MNEENTLLDSNVHVTCQSRLERVKGCKASCYRPDNRIPGWSPLAYPVQLTFPWPTLIGYFRLDFFSLPWIVYLYLESQRTPTQIFHSAIQQTMTMAYLHSIFALIESLCRMKLSWENPIAHLALNANREHDVDTLRPRHALNTSL